VRQFVTELTVTDGVVSVVGGTGVADGATCVEACNVWTARVNALFISICDAADV
jgi:hypothetical protein